MHKIGILTTRSHPLLPSQLEKFAVLHDVTPVLLFDRLDFSAKNQRIFRERTEDAFARNDSTELLSKFESIEVSNHNDEDCISAVAEKGICLLLNGGTPRRIEAPLIQSAPQGIINFHPGILPKYRGASCCEWAIHFDDPVGVTAHFMDEGLDSGPIISTTRLNVRKGQGYTSLRIALYHLAQDYCVETVAKVLETGLTADQLSPQPEGEPFKPIPDELLAKVKEKLRAGTYLCVNTP